MVAGVLAQCDSFCAAASCCSGVRSVPTHRATAADCIGAGPGGAQLQGHLSLPGRPRRVAAASSFAAAPAAFACDRRGSGLPLLQDGVEVEVVHRVDSERSGGRGQQIVGAVPAAPRSTDVRVRVCACVCVRARVRGAYSQELVLPTDFITSTSCFQTVRKWG